MPPQTKVLVAGQGNPDGNEVSSSLAVQSRSSGLFFLVNLSHSLPRRAVIVPVESRMCAQDLQTAPDQKREEKKVEEMRRPQPQWIIKKHLPELSTMFQLITGQNGTVLLLK